MKATQRTQLDKIAHDLTVIKDVMQARYDELNDMEREPTSKQEEERDTLETDIDELDTAISSIENTSAVD